MPTNHSAKNNTKTLGGSAVRRIPIDKMVGTARWMLRPNGDPQGTEERAKPVGPHSVTTQKSP